jgi:hypothetical protein
MNTGYEPLNTLKQIAESIWIVDGPHINFYGMPFPTRMTIIRLSNGDLFIHSPISLTNSLRAEVEEKGVVKHLISPNWIHYVHISEWQQAFTNTIAWASPNVLERAKKYHIDLKFDQNLGAVPPDCWRGEIEQLIVRGSRLHVEVVFFHTKSRTLILTDLVENFESENLSWFLGKLTRLAGNSDPDGKAPLDMRLSFIGGKPALRTAVEKMIAWSPERVVLAHGRWYESNAIAELRRAFRWVLK